MADERIPTAVVESMRLHEERKGIPRVWTFHEATDEQEFRHGTKFAGAFYDQFGTRLSVVGTKDALLFAALLNGAPASTSPASGDPGPTPGGAR